MISKPWAQGPGELGQGRGQRIGLLSSTRSFLEGPNSQGHLPNTPRTFRAHRVKHFCDHTLRIPVLRCASIVGVDRRALVRPVRSSGVDSEGLFNTRNSNGGEPRERACRAAWRAPSARSCERRRTRRLRVDGVNVEEWRRAAHGGATTRAAGFTLRSATATSTPGPSKCRCPSGYGSEQGKPGRPTRRLLLAPSDRDELGTLRSVVQTAPVQFGLRGSVYRTSKTEGSVDPER